jgi:hypothetical protein
MPPNRKLGYIPFAERMLTKVDIDKMFDDLRDEIQEQFDKIEVITDPEPNTVYEMLARQDKLVANLNQLAEFGGDTNN